MILHKDFDVENLSNVAIIHHKIDILQIFVSAGKHFSNTNLSRCRNGPLEVV